MIGSNKLVVFLVLWMHFVLVSSAKGQDNSDPKQQVLKALSRIEQTPTIVLSGNIETQRHKATIKAHVQGKKVWMEYEQFTKEGEAEQKESLKKAKAITKSTAGEIVAFDGKQTYSFNPYRLEMKASNSKKLVGGADDAESMLPSGWIVMGRSKATFRDIIESKLADPRFERMSDGRLEVLLEDMGAKLDPKFRDLVVMKTAKLVIDPAKDWLVVSYSGSGGVVGTVSGVLDWEKINGHWYVKHAKHMVNDKLYSEWFITEVSFNAKDCRSRFDDLESAVPYATKIEIFDAREQVESIKYKGGKEGEAEYKLIQTALSRSRGAN